MRTRLLLIALLTALISAGMPAAEAVELPSSKPTRMRLAAKSSSAIVLVNEQFSIHGHVKPGKKGIEVVRERKVGGKWLKVKGGAVKTNAKGVWKMKITAPNRPTILKYRIRTTSLKTTPVWQSIRVTRPPVVTVNSGNQTLAFGAVTSLSGTFGNVGSDAVVTLQTLVAEVWTDFPSEVTIGSRAWTARVTPPLTSATYQYRARVVGNRGEAFSETFTLTVLPPVGPPVDRYGPGTPAGIWGMDVSRWNHMKDDTNGDGKVDPADDGLPIDFTKAYTTGMRFVYIKGSDGSVNPKTGKTLGDDFAVKFGASDRAAAQAAGLKTGFYHYVGMVETSNLKALAKDAREEAILAASRVAAVGGYNNMDLPYALDLEGDDIPGSGIADVATSEGVSLWVKTWLLEMQARTGRLPVIYGSPTALGNQLGTDPFWQNYKLWIAHPTCRLSPADPKIQCTEAMINAGYQPGIGAGFYYSTAWTIDNVMNWTFWQYRVSTNLGRDCGIANGSGMDVNVFRGTDEEFHGLSAQNWTPFDGDYQKTLAPVNLNVVTGPVMLGQPVVLTVTAQRVTNGAYAVSGDVMVRLGAAKMEGAVVVPTGIGVWQVTLPTITPGTTLSDINIVFTDSFGFYAPTTLSGLSIVGPTA